MINRKVRVTNNYNINIPSCLRRFCNRFFRRAIRQIFPCDSRFLRLIRTLNLVTSVRHLEQRMRQRPLRAVVSEKIALVRHYIIILCIPYCITRQSRDRSQPPSPFLQLLYYYEGCRRLLHSGVSLGGRCPHHPSQQGQTFFERKGGKNPSKTRSEGQNESGKRRGSCEKNGLRKFRETTKDGWTTETCPRTDERTEERTHGGTLN